MNKLYWFNPENDLALAAGHGRYTPPRVAVELRRGGALLPSLWSDGSDLILGSDSESIVSNPALVPEPWGWSVYTRDCFLRAGCCADMLPSDDSLLLMRLLSHRRTSLAVLRELGFAQENLPVEATTVKDAFLALDFFGGDAVVKLPWSCSGRGVFYAAAMKRPQLESVIRGGIARQGSVMVERRFERIRDFAMLFCSEPKGVSFRGFSVFATDASGNYSGNLIASQEILLERLGIDPLPLIPAIESALNAVVAGNYSGWLGVDMMVYRDEENHNAIHPCIEVNLRMTMGVAALLAAENGRLPWENAILRVALPGEMISSDVISLSSVPPERNKPLAHPVIVVAPL